MRWCGLILNGDESLVQASDCITGEVRPSAIPHRRASRQKWLFSRALSLSSSWRLRSAAPSLTCSPQDSSDFAWLVSVCASQPPAPASPRHWSPGVCRPASTERKAKQGLLQSDLRELLAPPGRQAEAQDPR